MAVKQSVTIRFSDVDLEHVDELQREWKLSSRSEAIALAVRLIWFAVDVKKERTR